MKENNKKSMLHRLSRSARRGAFAGESLASIRSKWTTVVRTHPSTSRTFGKRAGDMSLRIGTLNVGSMSRRSGEMTDMAARRRLDFLYLQETRCKVGSARSFGSEGTSFSGQDVKMGRQV